MGQPPYSPFDKRSTELTPKAQGDSYVMVSLSNRELPDQAGL
jgi:hypothetical protein